MLDGKTNGILKAVEELEELEKQVCSLPMIFAEMMKDEINANEERKLYNGIKRILRRYSGDRKVMAALDDFTGALTGGATLEEILTIAKDEAVSPTPASDITVNSDCEPDRY